MAADTADTYPAVYVLTDLTGRKAQADRTVTAWGMDFYRRHLLIVGLSVVPAMMLTLVLMPWLGPSSAFVGLASIIVIFVLVEWRSRNGLKQRLYRTVYDSMTAVENEFILCGRRISIANYSPGLIYRSSELTPVSQRLVAEEEEDQRPGLAAHPRTGEAIPDMFEILAGAEEYEANHFDSQEVPRAQDSTAHGSKRRIFTSRGTKHQPSESESTNEEFLESVYNELDPASAPSPVTTRPSRPEEATNSGFEAEADDFDAALEEIL